jgi:DNA invertase Pin-like site-specific DNA recombinase
MMAELRRYHDGLAFSSQTPRYKSDRKPRHDRRIRPHQQHRSNRRAGRARSDLTAVGAERIFSEQVSSVASRARLTECLAFLRDGDVLAVTKPDRLARSTAELLTIEADLSKRGIGLIVLSMGGERLDTRNPTSKLMLTILAGVAAWEREIMLERQREGIAKAKAEGKYKGRPASIDVAEIKRLNATMGPAAIAKHLGIARSSVYRLLDAAG